MKISRSKTIHRVKVRRSRSMEEKLVKPENNLVPQCDRLWNLRATNEQNRGVGFEWGIANKISVGQAKWRQKCGLLCDF